MIGASFRARAFCAYGQVQGYWQHAEEFLAIVDAAAAGAGEGDDAGHARRIVSAMLKGTVHFPVRVLSPGNNIPPTWREVPGPLHEFDTIDELARAARLAVLGDCWSFLRGAKVSDDEAWSPYLKWADSLSGNDTILTFNYDAVPELLRGAGASISVIRPDQVESDLRSAHAKKTVVPVIKLHGSTTWATVGQGFAISDLGIPTPFLNAHAIPLMGFPGPTKVRTCRGKLNDLWEEGMKTLREAEEVIFIGYRFPPTDSFSREQLLSALSDARGKQLRRIKTVLGDPKDSASTRLSALLDAAAGGIHIPVPLLAQDFMDAEAVRKRPLTMFDVVG